MEKLYRRYNAKYKIQKTLVYICTTADYSLLYKDGHVHPILIRVHDVVISSGAPVKTTGDTAFNEVKNMRFARRCEL